MSTLDKKFRMCEACRTFSKILKYKKEGNYTTTVLRDCAVCTYEWKKHSYYNRLLLDFDNKVNVDGKWVVSSNKDRYYHRIENTLYYAYRELDEYTVNEVFYRALNQYWYRKMFTLAHNLRL